MIATCCHHLCDITNYRNLEFMNEIGLKNEYAISGWFKMEKSEIKVYGP